MAPANEYAVRLAQWSERAKSYQARHLRTGYYCLLLFLAVLGLDVAFCRSWLGIGFGLLALMFAVFVSGMLHDRILNARDDARRAAQFYQGGLERLSGDWAGKGSPGMEFLDPSHPYASNLDLLGPASLFELLNAAQTQSGRATLADWLLHPAEPKEILARQAAIAELRPRLDLRERLGLLTADAQAWIRTDTLLAWARRPVQPQSKPARLAILCLPLLTLGCFCLGRWEFGLAGLAVQFAVAKYYQKRVRAVTRSAPSASRDLSWLANLVRCLEQERFESERLRFMNGAFTCVGIPASKAIRRLGRLYDWLDSQRNELFTIPAKFLMWETQFAFALEAWRVRYGAKLEACITNVAQMEALSSLAGYAYEHPRDPFPELLPGSAPARLEAEALGHPLIREAVCVRNDLLLGPERRLIVVSGSNMSGKSTYLRSLGVNLVLAMAGAPVRARRFRMTAVQIGASIGTVESLQEGTSRFYAEIRQIGKIAKMADRTPTLVFLLDEILSGTNSRDRLIGASCIVRALLARGAFGLITTHDLALTGLVSEIQPPGVNVHFQDQFQDGRMSFDYILRPGVIEKSNALELMRSVGLDVPSGRRDACSLG